MCSKRLMPETEEMMNEKEREERIRARAYRIWQKDGEPEGRHEEHWRQAENEDRQETAAGGADTARKGGGLASGLQPGGTAPGDSPGATAGSVGTGGGSTAGKATGNTAKARRKDAAPAPRD